MTTLLTAFFGFFSMATNSAYDSKLPTTWDKDFTISVSHHGSMSGGSSKINFTYDSCTYLVDSNREKAKTKTYALTEKDRIAILKKLHSLKVDKIESKRKLAAVRDGWSQSICFGLHCIEGGTSADLSEDDKSAFLDAYSFLEEFASDHAKEVTK